MSFRSEDVWIRVPFWIMIDSPVKSDLIDWEYHWFKKMIEFFEI